MAVLLTIFRPTSPKNGPLVPMQEDINRTHFPEGIQFAYPWRNYQQRVLDELEEHLDDNHLHIIAPPGSGKTILGLEVALRLNQPTLIFAPTLSIRNQWVQRFLDLFLGESTRPDWVSRDIKNPKFLTVTTYQALHSVLTGIEAEEEQLLELAEEEGEEEGEVKTDAPNEVISKSKNQAKPSESPEDILEKIKAVGFKTLVVDEAHHLKNSWWKSLDSLKQKLKPTVVGLTATPPYDVSHAEWERYLALNGPVDTEITVPELVVEGDLCPHQDYVHLSSPIAEDLAKIQKIRDNVESLYHELCFDSTLKLAISSHPIFTHPRENLDWIYDHMEFYSASLIFLKNAGAEISKKHLSVVGDSKLKLPKMTKEWMEILLKFYLFSPSENFEIYHEHRELTINRLKQRGALEKKKINLVHIKNLHSLLSKSRSKIKSVSEIVDFEFKSMKSDLRMVILTDYIRKEYLVSENQNTVEITKMGVLPIFETLRRDPEKREIPLGVLTGSTIIIPKSAVSALRELAAEYNAHGFTTDPLPYDSEYCLVETSSSLKDDVVHLVTQLFEEGHIQVLVGTKSLLGEGWDAPSINALILASFVGSFVSSNQMRGRAIRAQQKNKSKTSNIWHLVCLDPTSLDGGDDLDLLKRRFKSFVGVSYDENDLTIENGIDRLKVSKYVSSVNQLEYYNNQTLELASRRKELLEHWSKALEKGNILVEEIKLPFPTDINFHETTRLHFYNTLKRAFFTLGIMVTGYFSDALTRLSRVRISNFEDLKTYLAIIFGTGVLLFGRATFFSLRMYLSYRDISKDIHKIAEALLQSLIEVGSIKTPEDQLTIESFVSREGTVYCHLEGGTTFEKSTFIKALQEIINTVDNPRYIIIRKSLLHNLIHQRDFHAVPEVLGRKKNLAVYFHRLWNQNVGSSELIFTRNVEGRKILIQARLKSLASNFQPPAERVNIWK